MNLPLDIATIAAGVIAAGVIFQIRQTYRLAELVAALRQELADLKAVCKYCK